MGILPLFVCFTPVSYTHLGETVQACALKEVRGMGDKLRANSIEVIVVQDTPIPHTPDSIRCV